MKPDFSKLKKPLVLDGAMGTRLQSLGLKPGEIPELWNLSRPKDVKSVHESYLEAGADVVYANTFGATPAKYSGEAPLADVIAAGIALSVACILYGALQLSKSKAIATYEIGLGILVFGISILVSTLLYNGFKRLSPFLFKHWKKLFRTFFDANKIVFSKMKGV